MQAITHPPYSATLAVAAAAAQDWRKTAQSVVRPTTTAVSMSRGNERRGFSADADCMSVCTAAECAVRQTQTHT